MGYDRGHFLNGINSPLRVGAVVGFAFGDHVQMGAAPVAEAHIHSGRLAHNCQICRDPMLHEPGGAFVEIFLVWDKGQHQGAGKIFSGTP